MTPVTVTIVGDPKGWQRAGRNGKVTFTPKQTRNAEAFVKLLAQQEMAGRPLFAGPVKLTMRAVMVPAASRPKWWQQAALTGDIWPTKKPDLDNIEKLILDAFNGVVWRDDVQVCRVVKEKAYGPQALTVATVEALPTIERIAA